MKAYSLIRSGPEYRSEAFAAGLAAVGYDVIAGFPGGVPSRDDVLIIWNRYGHFDAVARQFEAVGAAVIVAENGYIGADENRNQYYALSLDGHNGSGRNLPPDPARWAALGIEVKPWREKGTHIVVRAQRGIGLPGQASPPNWHDDMIARLKSLSGRPILFLEHHARREEKVRLKDVFRDCHAVVTWASSLAGRALVAGIPAFIAAPHSIVEQGCGRVIIGLDIEVPVMNDTLRQVALARLAANQWSLAELRSGEPFRRLLALHKAQPRR